MIPIEALKQHTAIVGKTGSGKTYTARGAAEELLDAGERVCVVDPTGVWWGLKSSANGKREGFPAVIFGGEHADVQVGANHGEAIAEIIGTSSTPTIIDTSQMRPGDRTKFFTDFASTLLRKNKGPLHLIVDEAHIFAPQGKVPDPQSSAMLHAMNNIVSLGRSRGLRIIMITQRPAKLHKDSLSQVETLIALRLVAPQDRKAVQEWIADQADVDEGKRIIASLPSLATGEGWIWAPELQLLKKVKFPKIKTFDSSRAPDDSEMKQIKMAPIDLSAIEGKLSTFEQEAAANDPSKLRRRIAELEQLIKKTPAMNATEMQGKGYAAACADIKQNIKKDIPELLNQILNMVPMTATAAREGFSKLNQIPMGRSAGTQFFDDLKKSQKIAKIDLMPGAVNRIDVELDGPQRKIVQSLGFWKSRNIDTPTKEQVAMVAGYPVTSGSFKNPIGALRSAGYVEYPMPGYVRLINGGISENLTDQEARDKLMGVLDGPQKKIINVWLQHETAADTISREEVAEGSGYPPTSGSFKNPVGALCTLGLLEKPSPGFLKLANWARDVL